MKNYEVMITAYAVVVVLEAENEEQACEYAQESINKGEFEVESVAVERELKTKRQVESAKRHAQAIAEPDKV